MTFTKTYKPFGSRYVGAKVQTAIAAGAHRVVAEQYTESIPVGLLKKVDKTRWRVVAEYKEVGMGGAAS